MIELKDKPELKAQRTQAQAPQKSFAGHCIGLLKAVVISVAAIIVCWGLLEFVFALTHVGEDTVAKPDPLLGYSHIEGQTVTFRSEGYSHSTINTYGFRDKLYGPKPAGWKRICVVGDSMTMGLEVPLNATFPKLLDKQLQAEGQKIQVLNCGMSGTGTGQQYLGWRKKIAPLQPDMLIVAYHLGDTDDNVGGGTNPPRPTFLVDTSSKLRVDFKDVDTWFAGENSRFYSSFAWFRQNSRVLAVLSKLDLDLQADPTYKLVNKVIGKAKASAWNVFLKSLPAGDWKIQESRTVAQDLLPHAEPVVTAPAPAQVPATVVNTKAAPSTTASTVATTPAATQAASTPAATTPTATQAAATPVTSALATPASAATVKVAPPAEHGQQDIDLYRGMLYMHNNRMGVTKEIFRRLNKECRAQGCELVIAALPAYDNTIIYYRELNELRDLADKEGFTYLDCWRAYPSRGPLDDSPYHFTTHFNCAGHKVMADTLHKLLFE